MFHAGLLFHQQCEPLARLVKIVDDGRGTIANDRLERLAPIAQRAPLDHLAVSRHFECYRKRVARGLDSVHLASGRRTMEIQGEMIGFRVERVSEIQWHDGDALRIGVRKTHDLACCDNRLDLLRIGHLTVGTPHHAMPSRNCLLIITTRRHGTFLSAGFTHPAYRLPQPMLYTPEPSSHQA